MGVIPLPASLPAVSVIPDAAERTLALDIHASWIVEAPAGSGKTGLLIQRFLKLLAVVDEPAAVLALTFTNKATAEMRERVLSAMRKASDTQYVPVSDFEKLTHELALAVVARDAELGWRLQERPYLLNIRTIDSLCGEIARTMPLLSGGIGSARPVPDVQPLYHRAAHAVMMRFGGDDAVLNDAVERVLLHRDGDLPYCEKVLAEMLGSREQWGRLIPLTEAELDETYLETVTLPRLNESLERIVCSTMQNVRDGFEDFVLEELGAMLQKLADAEGYGGALSMFEPVRQYSVVPGCAPTDLQHWELLAHLLLTKQGNWRTGFNANHVGAVMDKRDKERIKDIILSIQAEELLEMLTTVRNFKSSTYPRDQWEVSKALFRLLQQAVVELKLLFQREEVCDFTEIALAAREVLRENTGDVQSAMGTRLQHLLVDEMQDTSTSQYELLEMLTAGWDGKSQTLFLVGDPKQSIYLFRQARVELFQQSMERRRVGEVPLGALRLSANFRSGERIVAECNAAFEEIFPRERIADGDVGFHASAAINPQKHGERILWDLEALPYLSDTSEARRQRGRAFRDEASAIARQVKHWRDAHPEGSKIAVLARVRGHVKEVTRALARVGVPYRAVEIEALGEQLEVLDVLAITRALLHPADRTAWLALLRAPWCGLGVADLFTVAAGDQQEHRKEALRLRLRERTPLLTADAQSRLTRTLDVMDAALQHTGTASLADRVERTWRSLGGDLCTNALGRENVRQFLRMLDEMETEGEEATLPTLQRRLDRLYAGANHATDAVEVMTIHKAKGLEWDVVLVPGLHRISAQDRWPALNWLELASTGSDGRRDVLLAPIPGKGGEAGALNQYLFQSRRQRSEFELKRLFYVAATRARTLLYLSAWPDSRKDGATSVKRGTLLKAALPAAMGEMRVKAVEEIMAPDDAWIDQEPLALAAAAEPPARKRMTLKRLAAGVDPLARLRRLPSVAREPHAQQTKPFERPEGSFGARAVGNAIHAFVERLARELSAEISAGTDAADAISKIRSSLAAWIPAIRTMLRVGSLPADEVERATDLVMQSLTNLLGSKDGRWLLLPHKQAASEAAWRTTGTNDFTRVRLDRSFFAGAHPGASGEDTLWIIDFKTGSCAPREREKFLQDERERYAGQLRTYAEVRLRALPAGTPVMLALCYPLMDQLIYWNYDPAEVDTALPAAVETAAPPENSKGQFSLFG